MRAGVLKAWLHKGITMAAENRVFLGFLWNFKSKPTKGAGRLAKWCGHHD
jgi:hypothetical protein